MHADKRRSFNSFAPLRLCVSFCVLLAGCVPEAKDSRLKAQGSAAQSPPAAISVHLRASAADLSSQTAEQPNSQTVYVRSEADLRAAAWKSRLVDVNLIFDRTITVSSTVTFPQSDSIVRIIGTNDLAGLNFAMRFDGDWSTLKPANGLEFRSRHVIIHGLRFTGYEFSGAVLKAHGCRLLSVSDCIFAKIGTIQYAHRVTPPLTASDTIYNSCINAQAMPGAIIIVNNRFNRCIHNNHRWSHVIYISAESVLVTGNSFSDCGNVFGIGGKVLGASNNIFGNTITSPHPQLHPTAGRNLPPYLAGVGQDSVAWMFNRIEGDHYRPWTGQPAPVRSVDSPALHLIDFNDYSAMRYSGQWAANTAQGFFIDWATWLQMGFDVHSKPPIDLGVRMPE